MKKAQTIGQIVDYVQAFNNAFVKDVGCTKITIDCSNMVARKIKEEGVVNIISASYADGMNVLVLAPIKERIIRTSEEKKSSTNEEAGDILNKLFDEMFA